jgi:hypothetical protein
MLLVSLSHAQGPGGGAESIRAALSELCSTSQSLLAVLFVVLFLTAPVLVVIGFIGMKSAKENKLIELLGKICIGLGVLAFLLAIIFVVIYLLIPSIISALLSSSSTPIDCSAPYEEAASRCYNDSSGNLVCVKEL